MIRKKDNVAGLAWTQVVCPLAKAADPLSWVIFAAFVALFVISLVMRLSGDVSYKGFYMAQYPYFWYGAWALLVLATVGPIFNLTRERNEVPLAVLIGVAIAHVLAFIVISVIALTENGGIVAVTALLAATAAAAMVGIGWVVQHQSSAKASRRAHTFNILMQSRLSSEFQSQVRLRVEAYRAGEKVEPADAELMSKGGLDRRQSALEADLKACLSHASPQAVDEIQTHHAKRLAEIQTKHNSLQGMKYILNFYEFICAGINLRELDERMLRETLGDIAVGLYADTFYLRMYAREGQPKVYENLDRVVGEVWSNGKSCH